MISFKITEIKPVIINTIQWVNIYIKAYKDPFPFPHDYVTRCFWNLKASELELFIDSSLERIYFKKGDVLTDGKIAKSFYHFKEWKFTLNGTEKEVRERNIVKCLRFQTIYDIHPYTRNKTDEVRIRSMDGNICFMDLKRFIKIHNLQTEEFHLLTGALISPVFYEVGEVSEETGCIIKKNGTVIKDLNLRVEKGIEYNFQRFDKQKLQIKRLSSDYQSHDSIDNYDVSSQSKYEKYNGYNDWTDEDIDTAFEGDLEATWNVD